VAFLGPCCRDQGCDLEQGEQTQSGDREERYSPAGLLAQPGHRGHTQHRTRGAAANRAAVTRPRSRGENNAAAVGAATDQNTAWDNAVANRPPVSAP
jgi:hypothetical protein